MKRINIFKRIAIAFLLVCLAAVLSGCFKLERGVEFKWTGSVICSFDLSMTGDVMLFSEGSKEEFLEKTREEIGVIMPLEGYKETARDGKVYYGDKGQIKVPGSASAVAIAALFGTDADTVVTQTGFWVKTIQIKTTLKNQPIPDDKLYVIQKLGKLGIEDEFSIRVPYKITSTNGMRDKADDRRVTWDLYDFDVGLTDVRILNVSYFNWTPVFILIGVAVIIAITAAIIINVVKKKRAAYNASMPYDYDMDAYYRNVRPNSNVAQQYRTNRFLPVRDYQPPKPENHKPTEIDWKGEYQRTEHVYHPVEVPEEFVSFSPPEVQVDSRAPINVEEAIAASAEDVIPPDTPGDIFEKYGTGGSYYKK